MKTFQDRVAVITGAASGLGLELARAAQRRGMKLVLADVEVPALEAARAEFLAAGAAVLALPTDVSRPEAVAALADAAEARFGAVHLVFNNAGVGGGGLLWESSLSDWQWVLGVNLWGVIHGVQRFVPRMLEAAKSDPNYEGHVVNTASMAGLVNMPNMGVYNVSKHAVVALSETLYQDLAIVGAPIGASVLCPYFVPTGIHKSERNRPASLASAPTASQLVAQAFAERAVTSGKVTAAEVAERTFQAIAEGQFYIASHPKALGGVQERAEDIVALKNPRDPFAARPEVGAALRQAIRGR
ncbi:MAG: SDR family oxidoreductase [Myxococcota bacterium]